MQRFTFFDRHCSPNLMSALLPLPLALGKLLVGPQKRKENNSVGKKKAIETKKEESQDKNKTKKKTENRVYATWPHSKDTGACLRLRLSPVVHAALSALINEIRERNIMWWIYCYECSTSPFTGGGSPRIPSWCAFNSWYCCISSCIAAVFPFLSLLFVA